MASANNLFLLWITIEIDRSIRRQRANKVSVGGNSQTLEEERQPLLGGGSSSPDNKITTDNITFILGLVDKENFTLSELEGRTIKYAEFKKALTPYERLQGGFDAKKYFKALILADMLKLKWKPDFLSNTDIIHALIEIKREQSNPYIIMTSLTQTKYNTLINYAKNRRITRNEFNEAFQSYKHAILFRGDFSDLANDLSIRNWSPNKIFIINALVEMENGNTTYGTVVDQQNAYAYAKTRRIRSSDFDEAVKDQIDKSQFIRVAEQLGIKWKPKAETCFGAMCRRRSRV